MLDKLGNWTGTAVASELVDLCSWSTLPQPPPPGIPGGPGSPPVHSGTPVGAGAFFPGHSVVLGEGEEEEERKVWEAHLVGSGVNYNAPAAATMRSVQPNAINQVQDFGGGTYKESIHRSDPCGNTVLDDRYYYQYDAWNRLVSIHEKGTLSSFRFDDMGVPTRLPGQDQTPLPSYPTTCEWPSIGKLVKAYVYDGVGRLVRTSSPLEAPDGWHFVGDEEGQAATATTFTRSERFIYDGVRRIQEIVTDPILSDGESNRIASMSFESEQRNGGGSGGGSGQAGELPNISVFLRAEYIWGPGDNGVDELLCQLDPNSSETHVASGGPKGKPWYILTDAQGDVVSIVGVTQDLSGTPIASVAGQWTYSPYGEVLTYDELGSGRHPAVVFGHKTLAIDRLDGPTLTWQDETEPGAEDWTFFETRRLEPGARLLAYARNRTLDTKRGRWLQNDPNASGLGVLSSASFHGRVWIAAAGDAGLASRIGDGLSLYGYCGGSPIALGDSLGLFSYGELAGTMGIQGLIGGMINGSLSQFTGGSFWGGFASGAIGGAAGGGFGYMAFGASASGLIGQVASNGAGGFVQGMYQSGGNFSAALSNAWWSSVSTGVLGGIGKGAMAAAGASGLAAGGKSVLWRLGNKLRGLAGEDILRLSLPGKPTPLGFDVYDQWDDITSTAFSIKTMDTTNYSAGAIISTASRALESMASFQVADRGGFYLARSMIKQERLVIGFSEINDAARAALPEIERRAASLKIAFEYQVLP